MAATGEEALAAAESFRPHLVLLDIMLPGCDGFEVCRRVKAAADPPKVILLTARGRAAEQVMGLDLGAELYVTKPFSTRQLLADIRRCLGGRGCLTAPRRRRPTMGWRRSPASCAARWAACGRRRRPWSRSRR